MQKKKQFFCASRIFSFEGIIHIIKSNNGSWLLQVELMHSLCPQLCSDTKKNDGKHSIGEAQTKGIFFKCKFFFCKMLYWLRKYAVNNLRVKITENTIFITNNKNANNTPNGVTMQTRTLPKEESINSLEAGNEELTFFSFFLPSPLDSFLFKVVASSNANWFPRNPL